MEIINLPLGFRFRPTDAELIRHYLLRKVLGTPLPSQVVKDCDLYGDKEPWEIWDEFSADVTEYVARDGVERDGKCLYFFTRLKKKSDKRYDRVVGSDGGTWHGETVVTRIGNCGSRKMFKYERDGSTNNNNEFHWRMHEFSLNPKGFFPRLPVVDNNDIVLCRIICDTKKRKTGEETPELEGSLANKHPRLPENGPPIILRENYQTTVQLRNWAIDNQPVPDSGHEVNHQPRPQVYDDNNFGEISSELEDLPLMRTPTTSDYCWDGIFGHELFSDINIGGLVQAPAIGIQTLADPVTQFYQQPQPHQLELQMEAQMWMIEAPTPSYHFDDVYEEGLLSDLDRMIQGMAIPADPISQSHPQPQLQLQPQPQPLQLAFQMEPQIPMIQAPTPSDHRNMIETFGDGLRSDSDALIQGTTAIIQTRDPVSQFYQQLQPQPQPRPQPQQTGLQMEPRMLTTDAPTPSDRWNWCFGDRTFSDVDRTLQMPTVRIRPQHMVPK